MVTRHARRIYAGGIPPTATENEILNFFNDVVTRALFPYVPSTPPCIKVYLNIEKCFAFVEFDSIELCTACMQLDGIRFEHYTGTTTIRVRRPNDYRPETLAPSYTPIPQLNQNVLSALGASSASGPGKVFVGGLPYHLPDEQVIELLSAIGPIKSFHQVRDPGSATTKGYAFCEYESAAIAEAAIKGLNGLPLGDKVLTVRYASQGNTGAAPVPNTQGHHPTMLGINSTGINPMPVASSNPSYTHMNQSVSINILKPTKVPMKTFARIFFSLKIKMNYRF